MFRNRTSNKLGWVGDPGVVLPHGTINSVNCSLMEVCPHNASLEVGKLLVFIASELSAHNRLPRLRRCMGFARGWRYTAVAWHSCANQLACF